MHYQKLRKKVRCSWTCSDQKSVKRILVFGDSNAFHSDGKCACWPSLLKEKDPSKLNVFNESCDGRTTKYDIGECCGLNVIGNKLASHAPLDYVVVMLGTNDMKSIYGSPSASEIADGMRRILDIIDNSDGGAKPILLTPPPMGNVNAGDLAGAQFGTELVAEEYVLLAMNRDTSLVDIHAILDTNTDLESDMIHLNASGKQKVADAVWNNISKESN